MSVINKKNVFWNSISFIVISLLGLINFTLCIKSYDSVIFGYYLLLSAYWNIGASIDLGFGVSTIKNISESLKLKDYLNINKIVNTFLVAYLFLGMFIATVIYLLFYYYNSNITRPDDNFINMNLVLFLFAAGFITKYLSGFLVTIFEGLSEYVLVAKINLTVTLLNSVLTILIFIFKLSLIYLIFFQFIYGAVYLSLLLIILHYKIDIISFKIDHIQFSLLKKLGLYNFNIQVSFFLTSIIDPIIKSILSLSLGLQYVTYFETAKKLINLSNGLIYSALKGLLNQISEYNAIGELKSFINNNIYYYSNISLDYSLLVYGILNPVICVFIMLWFKNYETIMIFLLFLLPYTFINTGGPLYSVLMVEGKGVRLVLLQFINVISISIILYLTVTLFGSYFGIIGFYIATIINTYLMILFLKKYIGFNFTQFLKKVNFTNLITLNILLIFQVIVYFYFSSNLYLISAIFIVLYFILFKNKIIQYFQYFYPKIRNMFNKKLV